MFEQRVLHVDAQRQQAVEEGMDGRHALADAAVVIKERQAGRLFEALE